MTRLSTAERAALCDTALRVGEDRPTLCEGWTVKDLVVHLLVREGGPAALGIVVPGLAGVTAAASSRLSRTDFGTLVERLRSGPPRLSPFVVPAVDAAANTLEMFVHHEDVRRAQPGWEPRTLGDEAERALWSALRPIARRQVRKATVGVSARDTSTGATVELTYQPEQVTVEGLPSEVALFLAGRRDQARVELVGDPDVVARLRAAPLGT